MAVITGEFVYTGTSLGVFISGCFLVTGVFECVCFVCSVVVEFFEE